MAIDSNSYNLLVNISEDPEINATNFLESFRFRDNAEAIFEVYWAVQQTLDHGIYVNPSFKGPSAVEAGYEAAEAEMYMECLSIGSDDYNMSDIFEFCKEIALVSEKCFKVVFVESEDSVLFLIRTERNGEAGACVFTIE